MIFIVCEVYILHEYDVSYMTHVCLTGTVGMVFKRITCASIELLLLASRKKKNCLK